MKDPYPKVAIIVLNWNGWRETVSCLTSLHQLTYPDYFLVVVDNGSTDGSVEAIRSHSSSITLIETGKNLGYSGGNNVGIRYALESGAGYVWLLNNDTIVDRDCLAYMIDTAESDDRIGIVGSKIYYFRTPDLLWFAGGDVDFERGGLTSHIGKDRKDDGSYDQASEVDYITGCSLLAKREMIEDVGLLDDNYFLYFEDADWCVRARQKGWKVLYEPKAKLRHEEGARVEGQYAPRFVYYSIRNRLYFMKRFAPNRMPRCHLLQLKMALFFVKSGLCDGLRSGLDSLRLAVRAYTDYYIHKKMGQNPAV